MIHLYLHIGTHKTGTTTIQQALKTHACQNPRQGLFFKPGIPVMTAFAKATQYDPSLVKRLQNDIKQFIRRNKSVKKIVLSNENFCGSSSDGYLNSRFVFSMLHDATAMFKVTVIIYLRRQDSIVESMYTQMIHEGTTLEFGDFFKQYESWQSLNYQRMLEELTSCFNPDDIFVKSFHEASRKGLLLDFGQTIGHKDLQQAEEAVKNPSYSRHAVEIAKICNTALDQEEFKKNKKRRLRLALQHTLAKKRNEPFSYLTDDERTKFMEKYAVSNQTVADDYFDGDLEALFPVPDPVASGSQKNSLTYDEVAKLVLFLLYEQEDEIYFRILQDRMRRQKRQKSKEK